MYVYLRFSSSDFFAEEKPAFHCRILSSLVLINFRHLNAVPTRRSNLGDIFTTGSDSIEKYHHGPLLLLI